MERWAYDPNFEVMGTDGADFTARVSLRGSVLGILSFSFSEVSPERASWAVESAPASPGHEEDLEEARTLCARPGWLKIWYDSGHTVSGGAIFRIRHRDMPFTRFSWVDFSDYDVKKEKPDPLSEIGAHDSLFCWTKNTWPNLEAEGPRPGGWLASDGGSMEIADFIHLDTSTSPPELSLIHVKGAGSSSPNRSISVSSYEVVTGQAVKNLRYLDRILLAEGLAAGLDRQVGDLVWHDRADSNRESLIQALRDVGSDYSRRVVVLQPHVQNEVHDGARDDPDSQAAARLRQLDTLLLGAETACHGLGADFRVIGAS